jgi:hypothetical protein
MDKHRPVSVRIEKEFVQAERCAAYRRAAEIGTAGMTSCGAAAIVVEDRAAIDRGRHTPALRARDHDDRSSEICCRPMSGDDRGADRPGIDDHNSIIGIADFSNSWWNAA